MREFRQKRQFREMLYSRPTLFVLLVVLFLTARAAYNMYGKEIESGERAARAQTELQNLRERKSQVTKAIQQLNTPEGMEREIRDDFRVAKPGEHLVVLVDPPKNEDVVVPDSLVSGLWKKVKGLFGVE